tara:strand:+ start:7619 stop:7906 length:288 start_codon:yes stop_codon:yes gene_type:complete
MEPLMRSGDLVIYRPLRSSKEFLREGSIVIANHPNISNKLIIKRIQKKTVSGFFLIGENKDFSSDSRSFGLVSSQNIVGIAENLIYLKTLELIKL